MIEKKTILDQIEITNNGTVQVRFGLQLVEDGNVIDNKWHRTAFPPGCPVVAQIAAVNANLEQMGKLSVSTADAARIELFCSTAWTPDVLAAYQQQQENQA